jgi:muramoyltetrapeptide carboxypeptidase
MPPPLKPGDLLKVIAPSGALREFAAFEKGIEIWRSRGYKIEVSNSINDCAGYLAGKDSDRTNQLSDAWNDPECKGILCARGGYGSARILENWQWGDRNKWLIGFSDITCLLWSLYNQGKSGVHGAVLTTLAAEPDWSIERLFDLIEGRPILPLQGTGWGGGITTGILLPANLTVATHLLGTQIQPNLDGVILAIEDVTEAPYRIDRLLTQWRLSGALTKVSAIALGRFSRCIAPKDIPSWTIEEVLRDRLSDLNIPIVSNLPFGHDGCNAALLVGAIAQLDAEQGLLSLSMR